MKPFGLRDQRCLECSEPDQKKLKKTLAEISQTAIVTVLSRKLASRTEKSSIKIACRLSEAEIRCSVLVRRAALAEFKEFWLTVE